MDPEHVALLTDFTKVATQIETCQKALRAAEVFIQDTYKAIDTFEESYRNLAVTYHRTEKAVRYPFPHVEGIVKNPFEISSKQEYDAFFAPVQKLVRILGEAQSEVRMQGRPEELSRRVQKLQDLHVVMERSIEHIRRVTQALKTYVDSIAEKNWEYLWNYSIVSWAETAVYEPEPGEVVDPTHRQPFREGEEWRLFCAWVLSLPETRLAARAGRRVDEVAMEMLDPYEEEVLTD